MAEIATPGRPAPSPRSDRIEELRKLSLHPAERDHSNHSAAVREQSPGKPIRRYRLIGLSAGMTVLIASVAWISAGPSPSKTAPPSLAEPSTRSPAPATAGSIVAAGYVVARRQATVAAEITGRVVTLPVREGEFVRQGAVLATLDDRLARAELDAQDFDRRGAAAAIQNLLAQLTNAEAELSRTERLKDRGFATDASLSAASSRVLALKAQVDQARNGLAANTARSTQMRERVSNYVIRAPFDGVIIERNAQIGEVISPMSAGGGFTRTGICTIVDMESLELEVDVGEAYISRVKVGQSAGATLDAYPSVRFPARVAAIIPAANREKATFTVRLHLESKDPRVMPNMAVKINIADQT